MSASFCHHHEHTFPAQEAGSATPWNSKLRSITEAQSMAAGSRPQ